MAENLQPAHIFKLALRLLRSLTHGPLRPLAFFHLGFHFPLAGDGQSGAGVGVTLGTAHGLANGDDDEAADEIQTQPSEAPRADVQPVAGLDEQPARAPSPCRRWANCFSTSAFASSVLASEACMRRKRSRRASSARLAAMNWPS